MAKKNKGPPYNVPSHKFLVVVTPWSLQSDDIATWFEIMFRSKYPDGRIQVIYRQEKALHGSIIVELSKDVTDVALYLGEHLHSRILRRQVQGPRVSFIYEYDYRNHGKPEKKFDSDYPTNGSVPGDCPVVDPYPLPIWPMTSPENRPYFAQRISIQAQIKILEKGLSELPGVPLHPHAVEANVETGHLEIPHPRPIASTSRLRSSSRQESRHHTTRLSNIIQKEADQFPEINRDRSFSPSTFRVSDSSTIPLTRNEVIEVKKMDPYEEAEVAEELLRSLSPVKKSDTDEFLGSLLPLIPGFKAEHADLPMLTAKVELDTDISLVHDEEDEYKPSAELLAMFSTILPEVIVEDTNKVTIKPEPEDVSLPNYDPCSELLSASSPPPSGFLDFSHVAVDDNVIVKPEPEDNHVLYVPSPIRIKEEYVDTPIPKSLDPGRRHLHSTFSQDKHNQDSGKRDNKHLKYLDRGTFSKRIKTEDENY